MQVRCGSLQLADNAPGLLTPRQAVGVPNGTAPAGAARLAPPSRIALSDGRPGMRAPGAELSDHRSHVPLRAQMMTSSGPQTLMGSPMLSTFS